MFMSSLSTRTRVMLAVWAALMLACALVMVNATSAQARTDWPGLYHYAPDDGYDQPILVTCNLTASNMLVSEGTSLSAGCHGFNDIFVRINEEIWCKYKVSDQGGITVWEKQWDATGWHTPPVGWADGLGCTVRND